MIEVRNPSATELRPAMDASLTAFGESMQPADWERELGAVTPERSVAAYENGRPVGFSAAYEFELAIPGGSLPTAGVTWVGVIPTHRRRGALRKMSVRGLRDAHERGEPLAALHASEASIYGRFGYGLATLSLNLDAWSDRIAFREDPGPQGVVRLVEFDEAYELFPPFYQRIRALRPGMLSRGEHWWRAFRLADYEHRRRGASKRFNAALELDGELAGYAIYRVKDEWEAGYPKGEVRLMEAFADSAAATRELWRYLFAIDLTTRVKTEFFDTASPLPLQVVDMRALHLGVRDGLWLRLVDVESALRARSYAADDTVVIEVRDDLLEWNPGRYRVGSRVERTDNAADLALDIADLASAYLGGFSFERLAAADRGEERTPGALARASALFRTPLPPYCPEVF
ncbi:MAG TPA: GNAT family N-acetyltransferase [Gaiellaceae bacterium]|nr:GNAT family N-acetyltransferase [Gaiellaceae bacterium]